MTAYPSLLVTCGAASHPSYRLGKAGLNLWTSCQFITGPHTDKHPLTQFILPDIKREAIQVCGESATSTHKDSGSELNHQVTLGMPGYTLLAGVNTYYSVNN